MQISSDSGLLMTVYGTVINEQDQKPINSLTVTLLRIENDEVIEEKDAKTDSRGFFKISKLKAGTYEFILDIPGKGIVTIPHPTETEMTEVRNNQFKIEDGQNINMNFSIGIGEIPEIIIETIKSKNQINVIFHYIEFSDEVVSIQKSELWGRYLYS
jgi:5-hydroxyisourate hydrolase-like protein (transthyretin family)